MEIGLGTANWIPAHKMRNWHIVAALIEIGSQSFTGNCGTVQTVDVKRYGQRQAPALTAAFDHQLFRTQRSISAYAAYYRIVKIMTMPAVGAAGECTVAYAGHLGVVIIRLGRIGGHKELHTGIRPGLRAVIIFKSAAHAALNHLELQEYLVAVMSNFKADTRAIWILGPVDAIQTVRYNAPPIEELYNFF